MSEVVVGGGGRGMGGLGWDYGPLSMLLRLNKYSSPFCSV